MGLFNKLFHKKEQDKDSDQTPHIPKHKEDWDFYFSKVDNAIGSFYVDLGLASIAPVACAPNLLWISVKMNDPREDGLSSKEEYETLISIEDRLREHIHAQHRSIYAGRLTNNGSRDFYFYIGGENILYGKTISDAMVAFPEYAFDFGKKEDRKWEMYLGFMYPNPQQMECIQNHRVVDSLEKEGDLLTKARPVAHWIYFTTEKDTDLFIKKIELLKFDVISREDMTDSGKITFKLQISRVDHVDYNSVDEYVLELRQLAEECNGEYDGWETSVEAE